jgi:hypothetical protein
LGVSSNNAGWAHLVYKMSLDDMMLKKEIAELLDKESYRIWDSAKVIKNQDYHDGLVKGLKMASQFVAKL